MGKSLHNIILTKYCSFVVATSIAGRKVTAYIGHTHNVQLIAMFHYDILSITQYIMWHQFQIRISYKKKNVNINI